MEQFKLLEDVGLLHDFDDVKVTAIANDKKHIENFISVLSTFRNIELSVYMNEPEAENVMMRKMWKDSQTDNFEMLYLHSKGITSVENHTSSQVVQIVFNNELYIELRQDNAFSIFLGLQD